jgi:dipeptidyl aminopeptidase/acylaminoacyl peptidase
MKKLVSILSIFILFIFIVYVGVGFYVAYSILHIDPTCGWHQGSLPNTWSTKKDHHEYTVLSKKELRKNFPSSKYHLNDWQDVYFPSRDINIKINGWLFNYFPNRPVVIVVHGLFPNGKCKPESNLIASFLIQQEINALTIDLRNYGQSDTVSKYENLGLRAYNDVLGAFDFLKHIGYNANKIGLHGVSLGGSTVIFAAANEPTIKAIWSDSSLAEFNLILKDEIARYSMPNIFGPVVSIIGQILTGIDPSDLSPVYKLTSSQAYYFTHGQKDKRVPVHHFEFFQNYVSKNNIKANFWLIPDAYHVDAMLKYPEEYSLKMKQFFEENLK